MSKRNNFKSLWLKKKHKCLLCGEQLIRASDHIPQDSENKTWKCVTNNCYGKLIIHNSSQAKEYTECLDRRWMLVSDYLMKTTILECFTDQKGYFDRTIHILANKYLSPQQAYEKWLKLKIFI